MTQHALTEFHRKLNDSAASHWSLAEPHRRHVTQLLINARPTDSSVPQTLCILGAGNCNDLDLSALIQYYERVDLIDVDTAALERGVQYQKCQNNPKIRIQGGIDITGAWPAFTSARDQPENPTVIDKLLEATRSFSGLPQLGEYGAVASVCVLSQLLYTLWHCIGEDHPRGLEIAQAIRLRHMHLLVDLLAPGGQGLLVTDFVSSETNHSLPSLSPDQLPDALMAMISEGNFFTALNPLLLASLLKEEPELVQQITSADCKKPWLWNFGTRHYAVTAIPIRKNRTHQALGS